MGKLTEFFEERDKREQEEEKAKEEMLRDMRKKEAEKIIKRHTGDDETFAEHYGCKPVEPISEEDTPAENFVERVLNSPIEVESKKEDDRAPSEVPTHSDFLHRTYGPNEPDIPAFSYPNFGCYNPAVPSYGVYGGGRIVNANARFMDTITHIGVDAGGERDEYRYYENKTRMDVEWNRKHTDVLAASWSSFGGYNDHRPMPPRIKDRYAEWLECRINKMYDKLTVRELNLLNAVNVSSSKKSIVKLIDTLQMLVAEGVFDEDFDVDAAIKADIDDFNKAT